MIFGQIDPVLSIVKQDTLFNPAPEFITGSFVTAIANQYVVGANKVTFRVMYGECVFESGSVVNFKTIHADNVVLSGSAIETWGTDDSVILEAIAELQGTAVVGLVSGSSNNGMFM